MGILLKLYFSFLKIGMFGFGGGYAMLPFIESEVVSVNGWISKTQFLDVLGISQMTPGPVSINTATFVGYKLSGLIGGLIATLGVISFSFVAVILISKSMQKFKNNRYIEGALNGVKPVLIALVISAFVSLAKDSYHDYKSIIIGIIAIGMLLSKKIHPIIVIIISAFLGILLYMI